MKIPSWGLDQNEEKHFIDRYWGRVPMFLIFQPYNGKCSVNKDFIYLFNLFLSGKLKEENISIDLWRQMESMKKGMVCMCTLTFEERSFIKIFLGGKPCDAASIPWKLKCAEKICCNEIVACEPPHQLVCHPSGGGKPTP